jgi:hypothetical protein
MILLSEAAFPSPIVLYLTLAFGIVGALMASIAGITFCARWGSTCRRSEQLAEIVATLEAGKETRSRQVPPEGNHSVTRSSEPWSP